MALVIPEGFAHVIHSISLAGDPEPMAITYGIAVEGTPTPNDLAAACFEFADALKTQMPSQYTFSGTEVRWQDQAPPSPPVIGVDTQTAVGTNASTVLPQNCSYLVHKRSTTGGRGGRGRFYLPGPLEGQTSPTGVLDVLVVSNFNTLLTAALAALVATPEVGQMVILHDSLGANAADNPVTVSALQCDPSIATQRRRLR